MKEKDNEDIIKAHNIIKEAKEYKQSLNIPKNKYVVLDLIEEKRKNFEQRIKQNKNKIKNYIDYAIFEEKCGKMENIKNIFERGIDDNYESIYLWEKYIEYMMKMVDDKDSKEKKKIKYSEKEQNTSIQDKDCKIKNLKFENDNKNIQENNNSVKIHNKFIEDNKSIEINIKFIEDNKSIEIDSKIKNNSKIEEIRIIYNRMLELHPLENRLWIKYIEFCNKYNIDINDILSLWINYSKSLDAINFMVKYCKKKKMYKRIIKLYKKYLNILDMKNLIEYKNILLHRNEDDDKLTIRIEELKYVNEEYYMCYIKYKSKYNNNNMNNIIDDGIKKFPLSVKVREYRDICSEVMLYIFVTKESGLSFKTIFNAYIKIIEYGRSVEEKKYIFKAGFLHFRKNKNENVGNLICNDSLGLKNNLNDEDLDNIVKNLKYEDFISDIDSFLEYFIYFIKFVDENAGDVKSYGKILLDIAGKAMHSKTFIEYSKIIYKNYGLKECRLVLGRGIGVCKSKNILKYYFLHEFDLGNFDFCRSIADKYLERFSDCKYGWDMLKMVEIKVGNVARVKFIDENRKKFTR
ncbi:Crooked neck-like protein 1 [Spraguea lophii 42_110]|uniref:Crooked neck-like protein 1 n=1 Tax=Spraguea lophii (strain 42_110) TaxID=1358809 RepID=S7WE09_SPRLO|nr:Crooked neck-like protein 1 [Spraguea lophii 42_110]